MSKSRNNPYTRALIVVLGLVFLFGIRIFPCPAESGKQAVTAAKKDLPPAAAPLYSFYRDLYDLESGNRDRPVTIIQLGDSHTAGGFFSTRLRQLFRDRFGDAGRGALPPGVPFKYYNPEEVKVTQSGGWKSHNSLFDKSGGPYGLSGFRVAGSNSGSQMTLDTGDKSTFNRFFVEYIGRPEGGVMVMSTGNGLEMKVNTRETKVRARRVWARTPKNERRLTLSVSGNGRVDLLLWAVEMDRPGILFDSHGIIGATASVMGRWDQDIVAWELAHRRPSLIIFEYGGNEGFNDALDLDAYRRDLHNRLYFLKKSAQGASILMLGPSDGLRLPGYCGRAQAPCLPLTDEEARQYQSRINRKDPALCRYHPPPKLGEVRRILQETANENGYAFWDWLPLMDGECGMYNWVRQDPPLAAKDHVHLSRKGYYYSADVLFADIMYYYEHFRSNRMNQ